ncbi:MAG TPA: HAD hydrolase family protein, partial [Oscillospiraceae bacterium]|nr:HAD hydrolase family protein [Oscillospiraceae bacterium]
MTGDNVGNKDFSDWLVVSDVDGTLNSKFRRLPKNNFNAIKRFVQELNGNFTLASGRSVSSIEKHYRALPLNDIPVVVLNGSGIFDFKSEKMIWFSGIGETGKRLVSDVLKRFPKLEIEICSPDHIYLINPLIFSL